MKNTYVKPTANAVNMFVENFICVNSPGDNVVPVDPVTPGTPAANKQEGTWGNLWNK